MRLRVILFVPVLLISMPVFMKRTWNINAGTPGMENWIHYRMSIVRWENASLPTVAGIMQ